MYIYKILRLFFFKTIVLSLKTDDLIILTKPT